MSAKYLVRFDDICPSMNWAVWDRVEPLVVRAGIRPLVAVVPANTDPTLVCGDPDAAFWDRVRAWQEMGWTIAMHGYHHTASVQEWGICGLRKKSEFAGLPEARQDEMITAGLKVFADEGVSIDTWIAPNHTFDATTVRVLMRHGIDVINDGFDVWPSVERDGSFWIPCQLWTFLPKRSGVWTVCLHTNSWNDEAIDDFGRHLSEFAGSITAVPAVRHEFQHRQRNFIDRAYCRYRLARGRSVRSAFGSVDRDTATG